MQKLPSNKIPKDIKYLKSKSNYKYSGTPVKFNVSAERSLGGGEYRIKTGNSELALDYKVITFKASADEDKVKGEVELLSGEAKFDVAGTGIQLVEKASLGKGSVELTEYGLKNSEYTVGNIEAGLMYGDKKSTVTNTLYSSKENANETSFESGNTKISNKNDETSITIGIKPVKATATVNHTNTSNFIDDFFKLIGTAILDDYRSKDE